MNTKPLCRFENCGIFDIDRILRRPVSGWPAWGAYWRVADRKNAFAHEEAGQLLLLKVGMPLKLVHNRLDLHRGKDLLQFWDRHVGRANAANQNLSDTLKAVMTSWFRCDDLGATVAELGIGKYYASLSWHCLFAGYGTFPADAVIAPPGDDIDVHDLTKIDDFLRRCAMNFGDHKQRLDTLRA